VGAWALEGEGVLEAVEGAVEAPQDLAARAGLLGVLELVEGLARQARHHAPDARLGAVVELDAAPLVEGGDERGDGDVGGREVGGEGRDVVVDLGPKDGRVEALEDVGRAQREGVVDEPRVHAGHRERGGVLGFERGVGPQDAGKIEVAEVFQGSLRGQEGTYRRVGARRGHGMMTRGGRNFAPKRGA
jgi:hypothetical protein